jgi:hypothetical protein
LPINIGLDLFAWDIMANHVHSMAHAQKCYVYKVEEYVFSNTQDYFYDKNCGLLDIKLITA